MLGRRIELRHAVVTLDDGVVRTTFADGISCDAFPHPHDHHYHVIAHRCGYGDDLLAYAFEHEVAHSVVAEFMLDQPSHVLYLLAHNMKPEPTLALYEEMLAQMTQRFARAGEEPIISNVDWHGLRRQFLFALGA